MKRKGILNLKGRVGMLGYIGSQAVIGIMKETNTAEVKIVSITMGIFYCVKSRVNSAKVSGANALSIEAIGIEKIGTKGPPDALSSVLAVNFDS